MSYLDRLRTCRYQAPSKTEYELKFSELARSGEKKAAIHELPQQNTPEVQDLGNKAQRFVLQAFIDGPDYDWTADAFVVGLSEKGPGILTHPRWGDMFVLPLSWHQSENFVDGMGRATFDIEFIRVADQKFPTSVRSIESELQFAGSEAQDSATASFVATFAPAGAVDLAACKDAVTGGASDFASQLQAQISYDTDIASQVTAKVAEITSTIDTLMVDPQNLAESVLTLCGLPANVYTSISSKITGYGTALANVILKIPQTIAQSALSFLWIFGLTDGIAQSAIEGTFKDRKDAVAAAQAVQDAMASAQGGAEGTEGTGYFVPADVLAQVRAMMAAAAALLLEKTFSLRIARKITLTADRTPLDLISELKSPADAETLETALDEFIAQNALAGELLLMIPAGTEIAYYAT